MRYWLCRTAAVLLIFFQAGAAQSQTIVDVSPSDEFVEEYDEVPNVSGGQLMGLLLEGARPWGAVGAPIYLDAPANTGEICVRVATQDGRYRASNPFTIDPAIAEPSTWRLATLTKEHLFDLLPYPAEQIAVRAFISKAPDCGPQAAVNLPFMSSINGDPTVLVAYVNSGGLDVRALLYYDDAMKEAPDAVAAATTTCTAVGSSGRIAYNTQCRLELAATPARLALMHLEFDDGFSVSDLRVRLALPEVGGK